MFGTAIAGSGVGVTAGVLAAAILAPEVTIPALLVGGGLGLVGGAGAGYLYGNAEQNAGTLLALTGGAILAVYLFKHVL